ncbi:alpha/beta hydrolase [Acinetobacter sp. c1-l78]|uniref:alpha/beta hydrolase n=1 Tax=Acinetobacter sp. c1-l78 TaxID=3342803 RepID=UPI0035B764DD
MFKPHFLSMTLTAIFLTACQSPSISNNNTLSNTQPSILMPTSTSTDSASVTEVVTPASVASPAQPEAANSTAIPTTEAALNVPSIQWQSCRNKAYKDWFDEVPKGLQCAIAQVPLDINQPKGKHIRLALSKMPATSKNPIGSLLIIGGGPGEQTLDFVDTSYYSTKITKSIRQRFDLIGYAPRGIFPSTPTIDCGKIDPESNDTQAFVEQCITNTDKDVLNNISTTEAFKDIEQIRRALGQDQISLLGYSYGTKVLSDFVQHYPSSVRAAVLDGVVDVTENYFDSLAGQEKGFQNSFERFAKYCLTHDACALRKGKDVNAEFHRFVRDVERKKLKDASGAYITADDILYRVQNNLYWSSSWEKILDLMFDFKRNNTYAYNEQSYGAYSDINPDTQDNSRDEVSLIAISCADGAPKNISREEYIAKSKWVDGLSPYDNYKAKKDEEYLDACFYWPNQGKDTYAIPKAPENLPQIIFVAQKYDPTTPWVNAQNMAKWFNAPLITRNGDGHTLVLTGESDCIDKAVVDYLLDPNKKVNSRECK